MATPTAFKRILAAVDGSDHALGGARAAARLARALGARLTLLTVYHQPSAALGEPNYSTALSEALAHARAVIERAREAVHEASGLEIVHQYPSLQLADVYSVIGYDLRRREDIEAYVRDRQTQAAAVRSENESRFDPRGVRARLMARRGVREATAEDSARDLSAVRGTRRLREATGEGGVQEALAPALDLSLGQRVEPIPRHACRSPTTEPPVLPASQRRHDGPRPAYRRCT